MPCTTSRVFLSTTTDITQRSEVRDQTSVVSCQVLAFSLMHDECVAVRIAELRHPTNWGLGLFHVEDDAAFFQLCDTRVNVFDLESDRCSLARRFPCGVTTDPDCHRTQIVFDPGAFHGGRSRF